MRGSCEEHLGHEGTCLLEEAGAPSSISLARLRVACFQSVCFSGTDSHVSPIGTLFLTIGFEAATD